MQLEPPINPQQFAVQKEILEVKKQKLKIQQELNELDLKIIDQ
tara:strand:- start:379 stop:507 length:129 start_codon:yes stop_codon:yes gene_type:complete